MTARTAAELLANATCAVLNEDGRSAGAAWLVSRDGYLLTAGHLVPAGIRTVNVRFGDEDAQTAAVIFRALDDESGVDFAVLKVDLRRGRRPLSLSLAEEPSGRFISHGFGATLTYGSSATGEFVGLWDRQDSRHARLFKLRSHHLEQGFSGAPIFSENEQAVVALQAASTSSHSGRESETALAMPLYRVARMWGDLLRVAQGPMTLDLALLPVVESLFGRHDESAAVADAINSRDLAVIAVIGLAGIGKTTLMSRTVTDLVGSSAEPDVGSFDFVSWKSMRSAPTFADFSHELIALLTGYTQSSHLSDTQSIELIVKLLQERPTLLVLDNFDSLLVGDRPGSEYRDGYESYGDLIHALVTLPGKSTLCITTRDLPADLATLAGISRRMRVFRLGGVSWNAAKEICDTHVRLEGTPGQWQELTSRYGGNPLSLQLVSLHIGEVFGSRLNDFLSTVESILPDVRLLLDWHMERLSENEKELLYWLAINQVPSPLTELRSDLLTSTSRRLLPSTIQRLRQRTVVEQSEGGFFLQPVLIEYLNERLVEEMEDRLTVPSGAIRGELLLRIADEVAAEVVGSRLTLLNRHALFKATARSDVRDTQRLFLLQPLLRRLEDRLGSKDAIRAHFASILDLLRNPEIPDGYAAGNLINIMCVGEYDYTGMNFSQLAVWQAALDGVEVRDVNFTGARFNFCTFSSSFASALCVAWSPNDGLLAAGTASAELLVWDVVRRQLRYALEGHTDWVRAVAFVSDDELVSAGDDGSVRHWRLLSSGGWAIERVWQLEAGWVRTLAVDRERRIVVCGCQSGELLLIYLDSESGAEPLPLHRHARACMGAHFDGSTSRIVSVGMDGTVSALPFNPGPAEVDELPPARWEMGVGCHCVAARDGLDVIVVGTSEGRIALSDAMGGSYRVLDLELQRPIRSVALGGDGVTCWTACSDGVVRSVSLADGSITQALLGHTEAVNAVMPNSSGQLVATASDDKSVRIWNAKSGRTLAKLSGFSVAIRSLGLVSDSLVVTLGEDHVLRYWDRQTAIEKHAVKSEPFLCWPVAVAPDRHMVACASTDGTLRVFDEAGRRIAAMPAHRGPLRAVCFSPDGSLAATGGADHLVRVWDTKTWRQTALLRGHSDWVRSLVFVGSDALASGSDDGSVRVWNLVDSSAVQLPRASNDLVHCMAADSQTNQWLVCGSESGQVEIWDPVRLREVAVWRVPGSVRAIALDASRGRMLSAGFGGVVHMHDIATRRSIGSYQEHSGWIRDLCFGDHECRSAISCGSDGTVRLWDIETGLTSLVWQPSRPYEGMQISQAQGLDGGTISKLMALGARYDE